MNTMKREIKFRFFWENQMRYGAYLMLPSIVQFIPNATGEYKQVDLSDGVLMQYIGLKDKRGKEIYEGDIILYAYHRYKKPVEVITPVIWMYHGFYLENNQTKLIDSRALTLSRIIEIIGNIYETPHLLKTEENNHDHTQY